MRISDWSSDVCSSDLKEALGLKSKSGIHRLISALEERGFLRRLPNRARALEVLKLPEAARANTRGHRDAVVPLRKPAPALRPIAANDIIEVPLDRKSTRLNSSH